jgi:hypothetical protein
MGSEGTMNIGTRNVVVTYEPATSPVAYYGLNGWTKAATEKYLVSMGLGGNKRPNLPPTKPAQTLTVERGLEHHELFIKALREGTKSLETAEEGHHAAGAADLGNTAYRKKRRMNWDIKTNKVTEGPRRSREYDRYVVHTIMGKFSRAPKEG